MEALAGIKAQVAQVLMVALAVSEVVELSLGGILAQELDINLIPLGLRLSYGPVYVKTEETMPSPLAGFMQNSYSPK